MMKVATSKSWFPLTEATKQAITWHWSLLIPLALLWAIVVFMFRASMNQNQGVFAYTLDDPYIHMAMAKNFVLHGVWGTTEYGFTSASSSPLWTLMLAVLFAIFGVSDLMPLLLTILSASVLIVVVYWVLLQYRLPRLAILGVLFGIIFFTPAPALIFSGQEHLLHALLMILFVHLAARILSRQTPASFRLDHKLLCILACVLPILRYESLFLIFPVAALLFLRKERLYAVGIVVVAVLPIAFYGLIATLNGWSWLPNSVLLKGSIPTLTSLGGILDFLAAPFYRQLIIPYLLMLTLTATLLYFLRWRSGRGWLDGGQIMLSLFLLVTLEHMEFAQVGWFFRYEAYLIALGIVTLAITIPDYVKSFHGQSLRQIIPPFKVPLYTTYILILVTLVALLVFRGYWSLVLTPDTMNDRYLQHIQTARFVREFYNNDTIIINDIGMVSFYTDARILDLLGLGSYEPVIFMHKPGGETKQDYAQWAKTRSAKIGIFQTEWSAVQARLPGDWIEVEEWYFPRNVVVGFKKVGFYAVDPSQADMLRANLRQFRATLPDGIQVTVK